ncbi:hypothetical protein O0L34_g7020 [Tuta absoluta]|nr:hypothetical protein O0L34_g7020 [Tuta absoluta]
MPKKSSLKCYFGCSIDGTLHTFPRWEYPHRERFLKWKDVLSMNTQNKGDNYIFNSVRLCYRHFEDKYRCQHSRNLTRNAIPTLNLAHSNQNGDERLENVTQPPMPSFEPPSMIVHDVQNEIVLGVSGSEPTHSQQQSLQLSSSSKTPSQDNVSGTLPLQNIEAIPGPSFKITKESSSPKPIQASESLQIALKRKHENTKKKQEPENDKKRALRPIRNIKHSCYSDVSQKSVMKLKGKIEKITEKCKNLKQEIIAAKKLSTSKSFIKFVEKLPNSIKTFTTMQLQNKKKARGRRFTNEEKILALSIYKQGPKSYRLLRKMFVLPAKRTLLNLLSAVNFKPGINQHIIDNLKDVVKNMPPEKKIVNLLFDEVSLSPGLQYDSTNDEIVGFEDLGEDKRKKVLADHALVLMIKGI